MVKIIKGINKYIFHKNFSKKINFYKNNRKKYIFEFIKSDFATHITIKILKNLDNFNVLDLFINTLKKFSKFIQNELILFRSFKPPKKLIYRNLVIDNNSFDFFDNPLGFHFEKYLIIFLFCESGIEKNLNKFVLGN